MEDLSVSELRTPRERPLAGFFREMLNVESSSFNIIVGLVITINILLQGAETFYKNAALDAGEAACTVVFAIELALRLHYHGCIEFLESKSRCFDACLVITTIVNSFMLPLLVNLGVLQVNHHSDIASAVTFFRSFRILRVMRLFTVFTELSILLTAFGEALKTVAWIGVIGLVIDYMYAVTMVNVARKIDWGDDAELIEGWFGNLWRAMRTFFIIMTLAEWDVIVQVLEKHISPVVLYSATGIYILVTSFSLVSLITGILSDKLISAQLDNREHQREALEEERVSAYEELAIALKCFDTDGDGKIEAAEVRAAPEKEVHEALLDLQRIAQISMSIEDFLGFVELVTDKMGEARKIDKNRVELSLEDLVDALLSTRGPAQAHNLWKLSSVVHTIKCQGARIEENISAFEGRLSGIEGKLDKLCQSLPLAFK